MTDDSLARLKAGLDADEAAARRISRVHEKPRKSSDHMLRIVAAGRDIIARYEDCLAREEDPDYSAVIARDQAREYEDFVLPALAAIYSGDDA